MKTPLALLLISAVAMSAEPPAPAHTTCSALVGTCQAANAGHCSFQLARGERADVLRQLAALPHAEPTMVVIVTTPDNALWDEESLRTLAALLASRPAQSPVPP